MKKHVWRTVLCILLTCALASSALFPAFAGTPAEDAHLHFDADGKFRILNFSDIQDTDSLDSRVKVFLRQAVYAAQPDLIVLTGDNIYGTKISTTAKTRTAIAEFMDIFQSLGVPVAIVFGNHDDEGGTSKESQMQMYNSYSVSISYDEGSSMDGCGTYNVPIFGSTETDKVKFNLWMFDTGSNSSSGYDHMRTNQLNWFVAKSNELKAANGGVHVPSIAFQHIIVKEIFDALKQVSSGGVTYNSKHYVLPDTAAPGSVLGEHPCPSKSGDEFTVLQQQGGVLAIVSGHDHINQFIVPHQGIDLINTPGTGFCSYGDESVRGARIIDLDEQTGTYSTRMLNLSVLAQPEYYFQTGTSTKYVKNVALCVAQTASYGGSVEAAKAAAYDRLFAAVDAQNGNGVALREDLNGGSTSDKSSSNHYVICMGYTYTRNAAEAMRGLGLCYTGSSGASGAQYDGTTADGLVWNLCNTNSLAVSGTDGAVDLNAGTGGSAIYFVANYGSSGSPLTEIRIVNTGSDSINTSDYSGYHLTTSVVGSNTGSSYADLNKSAKGDYVYALYRTTADGAARTVLDSMPLRAARLQASQRLKNAETVYSAESMAALTSVLVQADAILDDLNGDRQTTVYDQAALDRAAQQILTCLQNLTTATFTVTFDADGGDCSVVNRTIRYNTTCGTLPTAQRSRYVLEGWYTEPDGGGERIAPDMLYTAASDQTWYAYWLPDPNWLAGDADGSGGLDLGDVAVLQRYLVGGWNAQVEFDHADVNADSRLDLRDVMLMRRFLAGGWNVELV